MIFITNIYDRKLYKYKYKNKYKIMVKVITTTVPDEVYETVKRRNLKFSSLIVNGLLCYDGKCGKSSEELKKENEELKIKITKIEDEYKKKIEELTKKHADETRELKILLAYLKTIINYFLNTYNIKIDDVFLETIFNGRKDKVKQLLSKYTTFLSEDSRQHQSTVNNQNY